MSSRVADIPTELKRLESILRERDRQPPGGGGGDGGDPSTKRLSEVEKAIVRLDATLSNVATKNEVEKGFADMIKWVIGIAFVGFAAFITVMTFVLNHATPKQSASSQPAVIILGGQASGSAMAGGAITAPASPASR